MERHASLIETVAASDMSNIFNERSSAGPGRILALAAFVSLGVHGLVWLGLGHARVTASPSARPAASVVAFQVQRSREPTPPRTAPKPRTEPPATPPAPKPRPVAQSAAPKAPQPTSEPTPALDLTGVTLTAEGGGFAMSAGSGERRDAPLRAVSAKTAGPSPGAPTSAPRAPRPTTPPPAAAPLLPLADLSRRPSAPSLNAELERHYPADARAAGISGTATVRARIFPSGIAGGVRLVSETHPGFGAACVRTVSGSHWSPPLDATGRAVATEITYRCRFVVQ